MKNYQLIITWAARIIAAVILLQTLFFKFTGAEESKYIFSRLGAEPWGRIGSGVVELIASVLILIPATTWIGALLGLGTMAGAIFAHLFILGISVRNSDGSYDKGQLFIYAVIVFIACCYLLWTNRKSVPLLKNVLVKS
jgi:uncharacterized membrane protein YphA (DoxX/SURF4 family)